jgi:hypothetical protein
MHTHTEGRHDVVHETVVRVEPLTCLDQLPIVLRVRRQRIAMLAPRFAQLSIRALSRCLRAMYVEH